ncbi:hypothetical protein SDC9_127170 [bioreactor metagenome]|uniref:Uncharacterized protein n=1 Tax=bioreactor metagenome TaxID=1076179 RepID=A0A645CT83_9ZZZZ
MGVSRHLRRAGVNTAKAPHPGHNGHQQNAQAHNHQNQIEHVAAGHRLVTAEGSIQNKKVHQQNRNAVRNAEQGGRHNAEALDLDHQIQHVHRRQQDSVGGLKSSGPVSDAKQLRHRGDPRGVQPPADQHDQQRPQKPGYHAERQRGQSALIHGPGETEDAGGGDPRSNEGTHAPPQRQPAVAHKKLADAVAVPQAAFANDE